MCVCVCEKQEEEKSHIQLDKIKRSSRGVPEEGGDEMTKSPAEKPFTPGPTECTSPTPS